MTAGAVVQSGQEAHALPAHAAAQRAIRAADDIIRLEKQAGAHGIGPAGNQGGAGFKAGDGILFNGQGMQLGAQTEILLLPFFHAGKFRSKMGFPESDMAHAADAENQHQARAFLFEGGDLFGVGGQILLGGK